MRIAVGRIVAGKVVFEGEPLAEGTRVAVVANDPDDAGFDVTPEEKAMLLNAIAQADRGELIDGPQLLAKLRQRS